MSFDKNDIRAAVGAGILTELQADQLTTLANARQSDQINLSDVDEPFELFRGFNEIFVVVGMGILFTGWFTIIFGWMDADTWQPMLAGTLSGVLVWLLALYFTRIRRMLAPSIALAVTFGFSAVLFGNGLANVAITSSNLSLTLIASVTTALLFGYWLYFRVPFTIALVGIAVFATGISPFIGDRNIFDISDMFLLTANGPIAFITIALGLIGFAIAMRFDMGDPHRVTRRSLNGFWLHIIAAPAIVNTVAMTLFQNGTGAAQLALLVFILAMAFVAIVIDRRSFLLAGVGYVVALSTTVIDDGAFIAILTLGLLLVLLGAGWEKIRARIMTALPAFPGKDRLPPYAIAKLVTP
ncbi:MAG: hypothetical protein V3U96_06145 [Paracoccaceae bacterium]